MKMRKESNPIGGYFGLEIQACHGLPHKKAIPVNFGRGGLELIIKVRKYKTVWIPDYICPSVPAFLSKLGVALKTYLIDENLEPINMPVCSKDEAFLYVNYFGVKDGYCRDLEQRQPNLILDLTQAFFYIPRLADGFNSARKFFGVPDGGFVYLNGKNKKCQIELKQSYSYGCCAPLLRRTDGDLSGGYKDFHALSSYWRNLHVAQMSNLSKQLLMSLDLDFTARRRRENFAYIHRRLQQNTKFRLTRTGVPLAYPYFSLKGGALRAFLIENRVFCPSYWPDVLRQTQIRIASHNIVFLPIDQRYGTVEMDRIIGLIKEFYRQ